MAYKFSFNPRRRIRAGATLALLLAAGIAPVVAAPASAPAARGPVVEVAFARFFGSCDADYGAEIHPELASGECGIITALVNKFNADNRGRIVVRPQVVEHASYYSQLGARIIGRDVPAVAIMHSSVLNDFVKRGLVAPLDAEFQADGIDPADFTPQADRAVTVDGRHYALPFDTHSWLWHFNLNLMRKAGLVTGAGQPVLPRSAAELLAQARHFKAATGKPYFIWLTSNDPGFFARTLMSLVAQQEGSLFPRDPYHIDLHSAQVREAVALLKTLYEEGLTTRGNDYSAALQAFAGGEGGIMINGTWIIGDLLRQSRQAGAATEKGYAALPFPTLYWQPAMWADNHVMVLLKGGTADAATREAALGFLKFLYDEGGVWARTGQLPPRRSVIGAPAFRKLPLRSDIAEVAQVGGALPIQVARQAIVIRMMGEALASTIVYGADTGASLLHGEQTINRMLQRDSQFTRPAATPPIVSPSR
jgi:multiple sugar transport system substrate-binding protein